MWFRFLENVKFTIKKDYDYGVEVICFKVGWKIKSRITQWWSNNRNSQKYLILDYLKLLYL